MRREKVAGECKQLEESRFAKAMDDKVKGNNNSSSNKKPRFCWSPELHSKFEEVYRTLLEQKLRARPKDILRLMNVPNLTTTQISSHLQKYQARQLHIKESGATNSPSLSKSSNPRGKIEITRQTKDQSFLPSVLARQSSGLGSKGVYGGLEYDPRTTNQYYQHLGLATNPTSYLPLHSNEVQTTPYGYLQTLSQVREKNGFPYVPNKIATFRPKWSNAQVAEMTLPNLSSPATASLNTLMTMDQFSIGSAWSNAQVSEMGLPNLSYVTTTSTNTQATTDLFSIRQEWSNSENQFPLGSFGSTKEEPVCGQKSLGDLTSESLHLQAGAGLIPPACWLIQSQYEDELAKLSRMLEEDPQDCNVDLNHEVDQYQKMLEEILGRNDTQN